MARLTEKSLRGFGEIFAVYSVADLADWAMQQPKGGIRDCLLHDTAVFRCYAYCQLCLMLVTFLGMKRTIAPFVLGLRTFIR